MVDHAGGCDGLQTLDPVLESVAGAFYSAERDGRMRNGVGVDPHGAGVETIRDLRRGVEVL
jgi:hypothetical protein